MPARDAHPCRSRRWRRCSRSPQASAPKISIPTARPSTPASAERAPRWCCCTALRDTGDMWAPLAAELGARSHGRRARPARHGALLPSRDRLREEGAGDRTSRACSMRSTSNDADLVTHDIGNMVGYAFAAQYPTRVTRWVAMDAPLPGIGPWDEILKNPLLWHFQFPRARRRAAGRRARAHLPRPLL